LEKYQKACASVQPLQEENYFPSLSAVNEHSPWRIRPI